MLKTAMNCPPIVAETERVFRHFNKHLFEDGLPLPVVTASFGRRSGVRYCPQAFEFDLGSKIESWDSSRFVCEVLHEMLHVYNHHRGVVDCTSNQYHNLEFVTAALMVGLYVGKHRSRGMACTYFEPGDHEGLREPTTAANRRLHLVLDKLKFDEQILKIAQKNLKILQKATPAKTFLVKWICQCPPPHNCIRSGRRPDGPNPLSAMCKKCGKDYKAV